MIIKLSIQLRLLTHSLTKNTEVIQLIWVVLCWVCVDWEASSVALLGAFLCSFFFSSVDHRRALNTGYCVIIRWFFVARNLFDSLDSLDYLTVLIEWYGMWCALHTIQPTVVILLFFHSFKSLKKNITYFFYRFVFVSLLLFFVSLFRVKRRRRGRNEKERLCVNSEHVLIMRSNSLQVYFFMIIFFFSSVSWFLSLTQPHMNTQTWNHCNLSTHFSSVCVCIFVASSIPTYIPNRQFYQPINTVNL